MSLYGSVSKWATNPIGSANTLLYGQMPESVKWGIPGYAEQQNYGQQKNAFEWQKSVQAINWQREDNAVQRRVADLKAAGLSPVLAAGSAAQSSPPVSVTAPQRQRTPVIETAAQVMALMRQKVDISRTEAETDAIMAQAERTRVQTTIDDVLAKRQDDILSSQIGMQSANAALARSQRLTSDHNLKLSQDAGTATNPSWMSDVWRSLTGQLNTPATSRVQEGINRAAQSIKEQQNTSATSRVQEGINRATQRIQRQLNENRRKRR